MTSFFTGNCTSDFSFPPPILTWYINDKKADNAYLQPFQESTVDAYGFRLYQRSLEIRYRIDNQFYASSNLNREVEVSMRCVAQLQKLPSIARDTRVVFTVYSNDIDPKIQRWGSSGEHEKLFFSRFIKSEKQKLKSCRDRTVCFTFKPRRAISFRERLSLIAN